MSNTPFYHKKLNISSANLSLHFKLQKGFGNSILHVPVVLSTNNYMPFPDKMVANTQNTANLAYLTIPTQQNQSKNMRAHIATLLLKCAALWFMHVSAHFMLSLVVVVWCPGFVPLLSCAPFCTSGAVLSLKVQNFAKYYPK